MPWESWIKGRFAVFAYSILLIFIGLAFILSGLPPHALWIALTLVTGALSLVGLYDLTQRRHAILRNDPIMGHFRFLLEHIRPEMRQYFFEDEKYGQPYSHGLKKEPASISWIKYPLLGLGSARDQTVS